MDSNNEFVLETNRENTPCVNVNDGRQAPKNAFFCYPALHKHNCNSKDNNNDNG